MSSLNLNVNGKNVEVLTIEDLGDKKRIFVGDVDSEVILRSSTGVKVQVGGKIIDVDMSYSQATGSLETAKKVLEFSNIEDNLEAIEGSVTSGDLLYDTITKRLYIYSDGMFVRLTEQSGSKQYLSFLESQDLTGEQKETVLQNAGLLVPYYNSLFNIPSSSVFDGIVVYIVELKRHYCLVGSNPSSKDSWKQIYLSSIYGGLIEGPVVISAINKTSDKSALTISGYYNSNLINEITNTENIFSIGDPLLTNGLAIWANSDGNSYIQSLSNSVDTGISFISKFGNSNKTLLELKGERVGINTSIKQNYANAIGGRTLFEDKVFIKDNISTELYAGGFAGYGMRLGKDDYGYWTLDIDNLTVRQRMSVYELVVNQIKATNGSLWVSDGAKIKTTSKIVNMPVYIKARYAGNYKLEGSTYVEIPVSDRPPYAMVYNPSNITGDLTPFKMGYGYGDRFLKIVGNEAVYSYPDYGTFIASNGSYISVTPTHRLDPVNGFVEDPTGEYVLADTIGIYSTTYEDLPPFFEGDLIRMQTWDPKLNRVRFARCQAGGQRSINGVQEVLIYTFNGDELAEGLSLVRIGNNKDNIMSEFSVDGGTIIREKTRGLQITGATWIRDIEIVQAEPNRLGAIYLTAADSGAPYIDIIDRVESHNAFNPARSSEEPETDVVEVMQQRLKVRLGKLADLIDLDMGLDGGTWQKYLYGIYTDSGFFKGNLVAQAGKIGDMFLKGGVLFTYNDGNIHTPMDFEYENSTNNITASGKINTNWLFKQPEAGVVLDGKRSRFSLGDKLNFENGVLTIDGAINATSGNIGGWLIDDKSIHKDSLTSGIGMISDYNSTGPAIFAGCTYDSFLSNKENAKFYVDSTGYLKSTTGIIAGWSITTDALYKDEAAIGTGMLSSPTSDVSFYSGCTYSSVKTDKENAKFYVLDDGSMKSTKGFIGGINIANDKLYTSYPNLVDKMRLNNDGLSFFDNTENIRVSVSNSSFSLYDIQKLFNNTLTLSTTGSPGGYTYTNESFIINTSAQYGVYKIKSDAKVVNFFYTYTVQGDPDPSLLNININSSCRVKLLLQKKDALGNWNTVWFSTNETGASHIETASLSVLTQIASPEIESTVSILEPGEYRPGLSVDFEMYENITWVSDGSDANAMLQSNESFILFGISGENKLFVQRDATLNIVNTTGFISYNLVGTFEQYFAVKSDAGDGGFILDVKGGVQLVQKEGYLGRVTWNIPGTLVAGEVSSAGVLVNYWSHTIPRIIKNSTGVYTIYFHTSNTHDDWFPTAASVFNGTIGNIMVTVEKVLSETIDDQGHVCRTIKIRCFNASNGSSIDNGFTFAIFGRNTEFHFA